MQYLEIPSPERSEAEISLYRNWNCEVDFCVWVLQADGLQAGSFRHHADGSGALSARGVTASDWQQWVSRIVLCRDPRLLWGMSLDEMPDPAALDLIAYSAERGIEIGAEERSRLEAMRQQQAQQTLEQYEAAIAGLPEDVGIEDILEGVSGIDLWRGSTEVRSQLEELWQVYRRQPPPNLAGVEAMMRADIQGLAATRSALRNSAGTQSGATAMLDLYFVQYPVPVWFPCSRIGGLIGVPAEPEIDVVVECVRDLSRSLA